jgi:Flp pilus assembly pilin Flp
MLIQFRHEKGQGLLEYALILVLVAIVVIAAVTTFGLQVNDALDLVRTSFP